MKNSILLNIAIMLGIAFFGYAVTLSLENQKPKIITQPDAPLEEIAEDRMVPSFTFTATDGKEYSIRDFKDKIIILNFWASWCPPCIKEFPHFLKAAKLYKNEIVFIGISSDLSQGKMTGFLNKLKTSFEQPNIFMALDKDQNITKNLFQTYRLPETIIIDQNQNMRKKIIGADWTYTNLDQQIQTLIKN